MVVGAVLGVLTLWGVALAWRGQRKGATVAIVTRVLSALLGIPAFFADDVPDWVLPAVGAALVLTAIAVALVVAGMRRGEFAT